MQPIIVFSPARRAAFRASAAWRMPAGLDELDVDAVIAFGATGGVAGMMIGFIAKNRQRRASFQPGQILRRRGGGHRLFDEFDVRVLGQPFDFPQRFLLGGPGFVGVHADGFERRGFAQGGQVFAVAGRADLEFQHGERSPPPGLFRGFSSGASSPMLNEVRCLPSVKPRLRKS